MDRFSVILWEPQDPINLGSVVRVCRNTGVRDLRIVRPRTWNPDVMVVTAPHSEDFIASNAHRFADFDEACDGLQVLYALTARGRRERNSRFRIDPLIEQIAAHSAPNIRTGFVFGREDSGLPNEIIDRCDGYITLESSPDYASMNLAQAVLLVVWSLFKRFGDPAPLRAPQRAYAPADHGKIARFMGDVETALERIGVFRGDQRDNVLRTIRQVLLRAEMDTQELATFWGVFKAILKRDARR